MIPGASQADLLLFHNRAQDLGKSALDMGPLTDLTLDSCLSLL